MRQRTLTCIEQHSILGSLQHYDGGDMWRLARRQAEPQAPQAPQAFTFPFPSHNDKLVQMRINRIAYLMALIETNAAHRNRLLEHELELRQMMADSVQHTSTANAGEATRMYQHQINDLLAHARRLEAENNGAHQEITQLVAQLPDDVETFSLFSARITPNQ